MNQKLNFATPFTQPITALLNGTDDVRLIALGDIEGMSPCYLYVDGQGVSQWAPITKFVVNDPHFLPVAIRGGTGRTTPVR